MASDLFNGTVRQEGERLIVRPVRGQRMIKLTDDAPIQIAAPEQMNPSALGIQDLVGTLVFDANQRPIGVLTEIEMRRESIDVTEAGDDYRRFMPGVATITGRIVMTRFGQLVAGLRR